MTKRIYDDIYTWQGWGGKLRLGSGSCRLKIFDLSAEKKKGLTHLRPIVVVARDIPATKLSIRSVAGHIATCLTRDFHLAPHRMLYVEYYPSETYGSEKVYVIPERYDVVEFDWHEEKAVHPRWRVLNPPLLDVVRELNAE